MRAFHSEFTEPERERANENKPREGCQRWHCLIRSRRVRCSSRNSESESVLNHFQLLSITLNHRESSGLSRSGLPSSSWLTVLRGGSVLRDLQAASLIAPIQNLISLWFLSDFFFDFLSDFSDFLFKLLERCLSRCLCEQNRLTSFKNSKSLSEIPSPKESPNLIPSVCLNNVQWTMLLIVRINFQQSKSHWKSHLKSLTWSHSMWNSVRNLIPFNWL